MPTVRDADGRVLDGGSSIVRESNARADSVNARVRVLRVIPDRIIARLGDTLRPEIVIRVSGLDSSGAPVTGVLPLFGRFVPDGIVRRLDDGRWLLAGVGEATMDVRLMRFTRRPSDDTALVRRVTVKVLRR